MLFLTKGKTNWKYILIVVVLAIIVGGGILGYLRYFKREISSLSKFPEIKKSEKIEKVYSEEKLPRFEDFPVYEKFEGLPAPPDFSSNADAMRFITEITEGAKKGPNFAGHYTIVEWGCGTECQAGVIVDAKTGKIYSNLPLSAFGRKFQVSSNLLIINPPEKIKSFYPYYPYDEEGKLPEWLYSEYYKWENNQFVLVYKFKPEIKITDWKTYRNEEYGFEIKYPPNFDPNGEGQINFVQKEEMSPAVLCSFLTYTPSIGSLEEYLEFYADKLGKKIISKEIKTFGEAKDGILYTIKLSSDYKEMGFIFNHGLFTYHFRRDDTHIWTSRPESVNLFLKMLSTLKLIASSPKVSTKEIANQRIYRNEIYGFEFKYPVEWGSLALQSVTQDNNSSKIYHFIASGKLISEVYYHQPSNMIAFIKKGEKCNLVGGGSARQDILQIYKDGEVKTLYSVPYLGLCAFILNVNFSPNGKYIYFDLSGYEWGSNKIFEIESNSNIIEDYDVLFNSYKDVYWSPTNEVVAIRSYQSDLGGEGTDGLFISDYGEPKKLNLIFVFSGEEHFGGSDIYNIHFVDNDKLSFSVKFKRGNEEVYEKKYEYIIKTKELKEIQ